MTVPPYEYKFIKIGLRSGFRYPQPKEDYHQVIQSQAKEGWRLVQVFAPSTAAPGLAEYFELIFERPSSTVG